MSDQMTWFKEKMMAGVSRFARDVSANVALIFAISAVPVMITAGAAVDISRSMTIETRLQAAADAASLTAALSSNLPVAHAKQRAQEAFDANLGNVQDKLVGGSIDVDVTRQGDEWTVTVAAAAPMMMMSLTGIDQLDLNVRSTATAEAGKMEVVAVVDVSGSMFRSGAIGDLSSALDDLLVELWRINRPGHEDISVGIVPYGGSVNLTNYPTLYSASHPDPALSCPNRRSIANRDTDAPTSTEGFTAYAEGDPSFHPGTALYAEAVCPVSALQHLTVNRGTLETLIRDIPDWPDPDVQNSTRSDLGLLWGWRVLSDEWRNTWSGGGSGSTARLKSRSVILMTDGFNSPDQIGATDVTIAESYDKMREYCDGIKSEDGEIYTVTYPADANDPNDTPANRALRDSAMTYCATSVDHYYSEGTSVNLATIFTEIGEKIVKRGLIRLTK